MLRDIRITTENGERTYMAMAILDRKGRVVRWVDGWA